MGFGFNLGLIFIVIPLLIVLGLLWLFTKKRIFGKIVAFVIVAVVLLAVAGILKERYTAKMKLKQSDYYGGYTIDKNFYPGIFADWQYDTFRFEIRQNDSIYFYVTKRERVIRTYKCKIATVSPYGSARLVIKMDQLGHHILGSDPTVYHGRDGFYLVFNSARYKNMFFVKNKWVALHHTIPH
ncbi:hypothetical protein IM792_20050 [Mucilaginibacter sp. JRF]|uniref:hypothetical protein n=1 Tax=Mucilaginibacter sp. JRF TaxID=2780088 RepID=UPI00187F1A9B|nr:hypothetical protein [Mucilaginibacter sp. JRF]MBE9586753.1 hypothetical protein [Mucilaginibacter sp. JRF]